MKIKKVVDMIYKVAENSAGVSCPWHYNQPKVPKALLSKVKK